MDIRSRILKSRLLEEMSRDPAYSEMLGLCDRSGFRDGAAQRAESSSAEDEANSPDPPYPDGTVPERHI